jgi:hypothetical protein
MAFKKIQPEQLQMPTFFSNLGDIVIGQQDTGIRLNLSRGQTGDYNFTGSLTLNTGPILALADTSTNFYNPSPSGTFVLNGANNVITNCTDSIILNGVANTMEGTKHVSLNGSNQTFGTDSNACTSIGSNGIFPLLTTGATILTDSTSRTVTARGSDSLSFQFSGGAYIETENSYNINSNVFLDANSSGIFSGGVNFFGDTFLTGFAVATRHDVTGMLSGHFVEGSGASYFTQSGDQLVFRNNDGIWTGIQTQVIP